LFVRQREERENSPVIFLNQFVPEINFQTPEGEKQSREILGTLVEVRGFGGKMTGLKQQRR